MQSGTSSEETLAGVTSSRARWIFASSVILALLVLTVRVGWYHRAGLIPDLTLDDAYISFRYARNLVRGHGLVYNVGERVEGYTNFLWTLAIAGALAAGAEPEPAAEALAALAAIGTILLLAALSRRWIRGPCSGPARFLPPILFAAIGSQARHVISGMETLLFLFLVLAGFSLLLRDEPDPAEVRDARSWDGRAAAGSGLLFGLAVLTRPEGLLYAGLAGLYLAWAGVRHGSLNGSYLQRLRPALYFGIAVLALVLPHLAWRWSFYGHPLPNTYYAKVAGALPERLSRGWEMLGRALEDWEIWPVLGLVVFAAPSIWRRRVWLWSFLISLATVGAFVLVGGDFLAFFGPRLLMPALPFALLLAAEGLRRVGSGMYRFVDSSMLPNGVVGVALLAVAAYALWPPWPTRAGELGGLAAMHRSWREMGEWLARNSDPDVLIATPAAGILPYVSDRPAVDMFGLTDEHIAHHAEIDPAMPPAHGKSDPVYVLERRPDYLYVGEMTPEGLPKAARLGWVAGRIAKEYELVAQVKGRRGPLIRGRWVIETDRFRPGLHRKGYISGIFRRIETGDAPGPR